ncbi:MAG: hypothetical protein Q9162_007376 [Coniocarpon cinnabarinum]
MDHKDQSASSTQSAANATSSAASKAQETVQDAATKAAPELMAKAGVDTSQASKGQNPGGAPGQEPVAGEKGGKGEPFDKGNVDA